MNRRKFSITNSNTAENLKTEDALTVKTEGLMMLLQSGRKTAIEIGTAAGARIQVGKAVLWNVKKIQSYLDTVSE